MLCGLRLDIGNRLFSACRPRPQQGRRALSAAVMQQPVQRAGPKRERKPPPGGGNVKLPLILVGDIHGQFAKLEKASLVLMMPGRSRAPLQYMGPHPDQPCGSACGAQSSLSEVPKPATAGASRHFFPTQPSAALGEARGGGRGGAVPHSDGRLPGGLCG